MSWKKVLVRETTTILDTIGIIDEGALQIALVIDEQGTLIGTVTDGDVRRGLLKGASLSAPIQDIMNTNPVAASVNDPKQTVLAIMKLKRIHHMPILDADRHVVGIETLDGLLQTHERDNWVVIMAGGLGNRLRPLTDDCPKPLLKVGSKPLLETIVDSFVEHGFRKIFLCVNYKADMIEDYFGDGSKFGCEIQYVHEDKRMGTAGALTLLGEKPTKPMIVMNGDLLTKVNFQQLLDFHVDHHAQATMCVRQYNYQIPYGVVNIDRHRLVTLEEKPQQSCFVNAGIYVLDPEVLDLIPQDSFYDMPDVFSQLISLNCETSVFPIREYWIDIGRLDDFDRANGEYAEVFG